MNTAFSSTDLNATRVSEYLWKHVINIIDYEIVNN